MNVNPLQHRIYTFPAAISEAEPDFGRESLAPMKLWLNSQGGPWEAITWLPFSQIQTETQIQVGNATALDMRDETGSGPLVLTDWKPESISNLFKLLPDQLCTIPGIVAQVSTLVRDIECESLRRFMASVFAIPDVFKVFWTAPASRDHHHAYEGGLAEHSLEVAVLVSTARGTESWQRDLLVVFALLHDIGKVWSYDGLNLTSEVRQHGHERLGYLRVSPQLAVLREENPELGLLLTGLLSCAWKRNYKHEASALGGIVQAMDRFSAARSVKSRASMANAR